MANFNSDVTAVVNLVDFLLVCCDPDCTDPLPVSMPQNDSPTDIEAVVGLTERMLKNCCHKSCNEHGSLVLSFGKTEVAVKTTNMPTKVYVAMTPSNIQVCGANVDMISTTLELDGFVIRADIQSTSCTIDWISYYG